MGCHFLGDITKKLDDKLFHRYSSSYGCIYKNVFSNTIQIP